MFPTTPIVVRETVCQQADRILSLIDTLWSLNEQENI